MAIFHQLYLKISYQNAFFKSYTSSQTCIRASTWLRAAFPLVPGWYLSWGCVWYPSTLLTYFIQRRITNNSLNFCSQKCPARTIHFVFIYLKQIFTKSLKWEIAEGHFSQECYVHWSHSKKKNRGERNTFSFCFKMKKIPYPMYKWIKD